MGKDNVENQLTELEQSPERWKDRIIWDELYQLIDQPLQEALSQCLVYEIPVPMSALEAVADSEQIQRGRELGLIEVSSDVQPENQVFLVPQILPHIIPEIQLPQSPKVYSLYRKAHDKLHELWGNEDERSEEKWQEIFRLLFADEDNPERFRQGFSEMLAVQRNEAADKALEAQLRQLEQELPTENLLSRLEDYLSTNAWREADEETAWILYLVTVQHSQQEEDRFYHPLRDGRNFTNPSTILETLQNINRLWLQYSNERFGLSIQAQIWQQRESNKQPNQSMADIWKEFSQQIGWEIALIHDRWEHQIIREVESYSRGNLPYLYCHYDKSPYISRLALDFFHLFALD